MNVPLTMEDAHTIALTVLGLLLVVAILDTHYSVMVSLAMVSLDLVSCSTMMIIIGSSLQMLMSVLLEQITVSRTVQTLLVHTIVAVTLAILLTVIVETAQVYNCV